jgi:hypothetical protein
MDTTSSDEQSEHRQEFDSHEEITERIIRIECEGSHVMDIADMRPFQGNLKQLDEVDYLKLRGQIVDNGFSFPISVWHNDNSYYLIDGHQRQRVLLKMREEGWEVPLIPIVMVRAKSFDQAKRKLLAATSAFGKITHQGLYEYLADSSISIDEIAETMRLTDVNIDIYRSEYLDLPPPPDIGEGNGVVDDPDVEFANELGPMDTYIVLRFDDKEKFEKFCEKSGIMRRKFNISGSNNPGYLRYGIGRVMNFEDVKGFVDV